MMARALHRPEHKFKVYSHLGGKPKELIGYAYEVSPAGALMILTKEKEFIYAPGHWAGVEIDISRDGD